MPIKPENRGLYPRNWKEIRARIMERAGNRCEWPGCGLAHKQAGYRDKDGVFHPVEEWGTHENLQAMAEGEIDGRKPFVIILTIAHLDHDPRNCEPANLRAWCQKHHLSYDAAHHAETRRNVRGQLKLFEVAQ